MIRLIAAIDSKNGIAKDGEMPWNLPSDLEYFKRMTMQYGANVLMGRTTYDPIGHGLRGRNTYVVSHNPIDGTEDVTQVSDLAKFLGELKQDLWVMGGQGIYEQTLPYADELYLTKIDHDFSCDKFFPDYTQDFQLSNSEGPFEENGLSYSFQCFIPKT
jgi:dihydrofolate reductase